MSKLKVKHSIDEGWMMHIYSRDRRLLCTLESSHAWAFLTGLVFGLLIAIIWFNLARATSHPGAPSSSSLPIEAPLSLD
jgi:hypothetical protein